MTKIARKTQQIFGSTAGLHQISQFGSLAAGAIRYTTDPDTIQSLSNYLAGWFSGVVGSNSPAIEDMNALCYLFAYQIAYGFQAGVAEWNSTTTYYTGSIANDGSGNLYKSIQDTNLNHALSDTAWWLPATATPAVVPINPASQSPYTIVTANRGATFSVNTANGAQTFTLPTPVSGFQFTIKDSAGSCGTNVITVAQHAAETIEGLAASYVCRADWGDWTFESDGTNWFLIA